MRATIFNIALPVYRSRAEAFHVTSYTSGQSAAIGASHRQSSPRACPAGGRAKRCGFCPTLPVQGQRGVL